MTAPLRPMNLGEILDRTFQIYRSRFLVFAGIAALPALAMTALQVAGNLVGPQITVSFAFRDSIQKLEYWLNYGNVESYLFFLTWLAFAYVTSRILLQEEPTIESAFSWCVSRWQSCLAVAAVLWLVLHLLPAMVYRFSWVGPATLSARIGVMDGETTLSRWLGSFLVLLAQWLAEAVLAVALSLSIPAWALERPSIPSALQRGWNLANGSRLRILGAWSLAYVLHWVLFFTFSLVFTPMHYFLYEILSRWHLHYMDYQAIAFLPVTAASILTGPLFPIAITLFYYDQRIRLEGYDIERMMDAAGMNPPGASLTGDSPTMPITEEVQP